jgi:gliding motility-associated lipoprotein GldH
MFSCDKSRVFEDTSSFNKAYWLADSVKQFEFKIEDRYEYNLLFSIRNGREYPHNNMYVRYAILDSTNTVLDEELRNFQLFNQKTGYPLGRGSGNIYEHLFDLVVDYDFPYPGNFKVEFEQYMRYDSLPEVYSIGLRVEHSEP